MQEIRNKLEREMEDLVQKNCHDNLPIIIPKMASAIQSTKEEGTVQIEYSKNEGFGQFSNPSILPKQLLKGRRKSSKRLNSTKESEKIDISKNANEDFDFYSMRDQKDFKTRVFLTSLEIPSTFHDNDLANENAEVNNFWVRTHHSDCIGALPFMTKDGDGGGSAECPFRLVKDFFQAAYTNQDHMVAKAALTKLMTILYEYEKDEYYAFATILASGLSDKANNTSFQLKDSIDAKGLVNEADNVEEAREQLIILMDIVFRMMSVKRFLIDDDFSNIFRLVHCETKGQRNKLSLTYVFFSFLLQFCLATFCITEVLEEFRKEEEGYYGNDMKEIKVQFIILASLGSSFGFLSQFSEFKSALRVMRFYNKFGPLQAIDFTVNVIIPLLIVIVGFWLVASQDNFVDAVIMTTALLFIPEIDDQLPDLLGFDRDAIIETYLVREAKNLYNDYHRVNGDTLNIDFGSKCASLLQSNTPLSHTMKSRKTGVEFSDYFITNLATAAFTPKDNTIGVFSIGHDTTCGHEIFPTKFISDDCLVETVEWIYSTDKSTSTISWLKLVKMNGEVVEKGYSSKIQKRKVHRICGVFVITDIIMESSCISSLRLCGSEKASDFKNAMDYYSLWNMTVEAKYLLKTHVAHAIAKKGEKSIATNDSDYRPMA